MFQNSCFQSLLDTFESFGICEPPQLPPQIEVEGIENLFGWQTTTCTYAIDNLVSGPGLIISDGICSQRNATSFFV